MGYFVSEPSLFNIQEVQEGQGQTHMANEGKNPEKTLLVQPNPPSYTWVAWKKPFPDRKQWEKVFKKWYLSGRKQLSLGRAWARLQKYSVFIQAIK